MVVKREKTCAEKEPRSRAAILLRAAVALAAVSAGFNLLSNMGASQLAAAKAASATANFSGRHAIVVGGTSGTARHLPHRVAYRSSLGTCLI